MIGLAHFVPKAQNVGFPVVQLDSHVDEQLVCLIEFLLGLSKLCLTGVDTLLEALVLFCEPLVILSALSGLGLGFVVVRWWGRRDRQACRYQPQILRLTDV